MNQSSDIRSYEEEYGGEQSIKILLQLYLDNSETSMKVSGLTFYALQVNIMNLPDTKREFMSIHCHTILTFKSVYLFQY